MHGQLTPQRPESTNQRLADMPVQADAREDDGPVLRFGFTFQHLEALARRAVRDHFPSRARDWEDRYEAAWGAAVERLYAAPESEPVSSLDLLKAATRGLNQLGRISLRDQGLAYRRQIGELGAAPLFWQYWTSPGPALPEEKAVERTALAQIMARLSPAQREALAALAEHGSHRAAADALGVPLRTFDTRLARARRAYLALWHEHETPSRKVPDAPAYGRALHSQPSGPAEEAGALAAIAEAFGERARVPSRDLLPALATADPGRYGDWDPVDLGRFLARYHVRPRNIDLYDGPQRDGRGRVAKGYWLSEVAAALEDLAAGAVPVLQAAA